MIELIQFPWSPYCLVQRRVFDLWGMLSNFLYSGHYSVHAIHPKLRVWYRRMSKTKSADS